MISETNVENGRNGWADRLKEWYEPLKNSSTVSLSRKRTVGENGRDGRVDILKNEWYAPLNNSWKMRTRAENGRDGRSQQQQGRQKLAGAMLAVRLLGRFDQFIQSGLWIIPFDLECVLKTRWKRRGRKSQGWKAGTRWENYPQGCMSHLANMVSSIFVQCYSYLFPLNFMHQLHR